MSLDLSPKEVARALGGEVAGRDAVLAPGPRHSRSDRSLSVKLDTAAPDGFVVTSFANDDPIACRDYVRERLRMPAWQPTRGADRRPVNPPRKSSPAGAGSPAAPGRRDERRDDSPTAEIAMTVWREAGPVRGSIAERYLESRGLWLTDEIAEGGALRFAPSCTFKLADGSRINLPAMVALMTDATTGEPRAIHRTALKPDGSGKADIAGLGDPKKMLGPSRGAVIRLTGDFQPGQPLGVSEGIENGIAAHCAGFGSIGTTWAAGSAANLGALPVLPEVGRLCLLADTGEAGEKAAATTGQRWADAGKQAEALFPAAGDWNVCLKEGGEAAKDDAGAIVQHAESENRLLRFDLGIGRSVSYGAAAPAIRATPFVWRDPREIPERQPIYASHYIRKFVGCTLAPGGIGKTTLGIAEHLAMVTGRPLLGIKPVERVRTWIFNAEDPHEEIERRIAAACIHFEIDPAEIAGRLFVDSGRDMKIVIATQTRDGAMIAKPVVDDLIATIRENRIDVISVDPFVSSHAVTENDNNAIDAVVKAWAGIAGATGCAIELVHHVRKKPPGEEITIDDGRGAVALINGARSARVLNPMSEQEAERFGVENRRLFFRADNGKASLFPPPPADKATWFRHASIDLGNGANGRGDNVGVVTAWQAPDALAGVTVKDLLAAQKAIHKGRWRENVQAADWVGKPVAVALGLDLDRPADKRKVKFLLKLWLESGALGIVQDKDDKGNMRPFVEVGEWANE